MSFWDAGIHFGGKKPADSTNFRQKNVTGMSKRGGNYEKTSVFFVVATWRRLPQRKVDNHFGWVFPVFSSNLVISVSPFEAPSEKFRVPGARSHGHCHWTTILPNFRFRGVFPFILAISCCRPKWGGNYEKHRGFFVVATPGGRPVASQMSKMCVLPLFSRHFRHFVLSADMGWQLRKNLGVFRSCHPRGGDRSHVGIPF